MKKRIFSALLALTLLSAPALVAVAAPDGAAETGSAPEAQNLEIETPRGSAYTGKLEAEDADGDLSGFEITTPPIKGTVALQPDGSFVYTPLVGRRGRDYFGYKAVDARGNLSQEATVIIRLTKPEA